MIPAGPVIAAILALHPCQREPLDVPRLEQIGQAIAAVSADRYDAGALITIAYYESSFCQDVQDGTRRGWPSGQGLWQIEAGSNRTPPFYGLSYEATEHAAGQALWLWHHSAACGDARKRFGLYAGLGCRSWSGAIPRANLYWWLTQKVPSLMSSHDDIEFDTADFEGLKLKDDSAPTIPAPEDDPIAMIRELRQALAHVGALCVSLDTALCRTMLAGLTVEHKANQLREDLDKHVADDRRHNPLPAAAE